jgi:hypothetical protein
MNSYREIRLMRIALGLVLMLTAVSVPARADDTWHNIYHSLKHFFTGKSSSSATPAVHYHVKHATSPQDTEQAGQSSPAPSASVAGGQQSAAAAPEASATPRVVVLPAATPAAAGSQRPANSEPTAGSAGEQPTTASASAARPTESAGRTDSATDAGPVLRSLSDQGAAANPTPTPR